MRKALLFVCCALFFCCFLTSGKVNAATYTCEIVKTWDYGNDEPDGCWRFMYYDEWGGKNYQCQRAGCNVCTTWSWQARYPCLTWEEEDPCPEINNVNYGKNLAETEAWNCCGVTLDPEAEWNFTWERVPYGSYP